MKPRSGIGATILIVLGVIFFVHLGWLPRLGPLMGQWWPLILIAVGLLALTGRSRRWKAAIRYDRCFL